MRDSETKVNVEQALELLARVAPDVSISEHEPGHITLSISFSGLWTLISGLDNLASADIEGGLCAIPGLNRCEISAFWRTAVIEYDPAVLPYHLWEQLFRPGEGEEFDPATLDQLRRVVGI
jgi:hypothetical protein